MENNENNKPKIVYRYNIKAIVTIVGLLLTSMPLISNTVRNIESSNNKFYDSITHEIITPGFSPSSLIMDFILLFVIVIILIIAIKKLKISLYEIHCPYCGKITYIETGLEAADCEICGQRIYMKNGTLEKIH